MVDLHMHSYYSDGVYAPKKLAQRAKNLGFSIISLTDHNSIDGLNEFLRTAKNLKLKAISGVEIYTHYKDKHLHILGHDFDRYDKDLNKTLKKLQKNHIPQAKRTIEALQDNNWNIDEEQVFNTKAAYIGVSTIASALKKDHENWERIQYDFQMTQQTKKIIPITAIISKYFFNTYGRIYEESEIAIDKAIAIIKNAGGKTVLAHPGQHLSWSDNNIIAELKNIGLDGIEAITSHHSWGQIEHWQIIAKELDLMITAGSDFHGYVPKEWDFIVRGPWDYFYGK